MNILVFRLIHNCLVKPVLQPRSRALGYMILVLLLSNCNQSKKNIEKGQLVAADDYDTAELTIQRGMAVFNQHCASCHNFNEAAIGPNLAGITSEVSKEWLVKFIRNPQKSIESGDERAQELYTKYKTFMPSFEMLKDNELEDVLGFIHKFSEAERRSQKKRAGGIIDPIPKKIPDPELTLVIEEFCTVPPSSDTAPRARINKLVALAGQEGERLFIADLRGTLYELVDKEAVVFLDVKEAITDFINHPGWGTGLGSFDFHPEFEKNGLFYTTHTEPSKTAVADFAIPDSIPTKLQWVLTEWEMNIPTAPEFSGNKREVLRADMVSGAHGFQELTFNPVAQKGDDDYGLLYLGIGDGAAALAGYPFLCDNAGAIWGSVVRIDPLGRDSRNGKYGIPKDNPFVTDSDKLDEIWSYGFRNPHRISWDTNGSENIFVSNIGQHSVEEVNLLKKGANYGWPFREGTFLFDTEANTEIVYPLPEEDDAFMYPVIQFDHDEGNAVSGGFVYAGNSIPLLENTYIFGDIPGGTLFYSNVEEIEEGTQAPIFKLGLELDGESTSLRELSSGQRVDLRLGIDTSGELFLFTKSNGTVYKVVGCKPQDSAL